MAFKMKPGVKAYSDDGNVVGSVDRGHFWGQSAFDRGAEVENNPATPSFLSNDAGLL